MPFANKEQTVTDYFLCVRASTGHTSLSTDIHLHLSNKLCEIVLYWERQTTMAYKEMIKVVSVHHLQVDRDSSSISPSIIYSRFKVSSGLRIHNVREMFSTLSAYPAWETCREHHKNDLHTVLLSRIHFVLFTPQHKAEFCVFYSISCYKSVKTWDNCEWEKCDTTGPLVFISMCEEYMCVKSITACAPPRAECVAIVYQDSCDATRSYKWINTNVIDCGYNLVNV